MTTNIGDILREAREKQNLTLEDIEGAIKIRRKNLVAIEAGEWGVFPSKIYIQGIISSYGKFLKLEEDKLIAYFRREYEQRDPLHFKTKATKEQFTPHARKIAKRIILAIVFLFVMYFTYQLKIFYTPPKVTILEPKNTTFKKEKITLKGETEADSVITVNGKAVFLNEKNLFQTDVPLPEAINSVTIEVTGANGKKTIIKKVFTRKF